MSWLFSAFINAQNRKKKKKATKISYRDRNTEPERPSHSFVRVYKFVESIINI